MYINLDGIIRRRPTLSKIVLTSDSFLIIRKLYEPVDRRTI